jgi:hypothetical protein
MVKGKDQPKTVKDGESILPPGFDPEAETVDTTFCGSTDDWTLVTSLDDLWRFTTGKAAMGPGSDFIVLRTYHGDRYVETCDKALALSKTRYVSNQWHNPQKPESLMQIHFNSSNNRFSFMCKNGCYIGTNWEDALVCQEGKCEWELYLKDKKEYGDVLKNFYLRIWHPSLKRWCKAYKGSHHWVVEASKKNADDWCLFYPWKTGVNEDDWDSSDKKVCLGHLNNQGSGPATLEVDQTVGRTKSESTSLTVSEWVEFSAGAEFGKGFSASVTSHVGCDWTKVSSTAYEVSQTTKVSTEVPSGEHKGIYQVHGLWGPFTMHVGEWTVEDYHEED